MLNNILIIISFIAGVFAGVYCLRLGMMWTSKEQPTPVKLPLTPFINKPPPSDEEPTEDKTLEHWFEGDKR